MKNKLYIIALICAILGFSSILLGTVAFYQTTFKGETKASAKKFSFDVYHNNNQLENINLYDTIEENERDKAIIIPGDKGKIELVILGKESEVNIEYEITLTSNNIPTNMKFYLDSKTNEIDISNNKIEGRMNYGQEMKKNHTIYWEWPYDSGDKNEEDYNYQGKSFVISITASGKQIIE